MSNPAESQRANAQEKLFIQRVRELREERGWSQSELAEQCRRQGLEYMTQSTISRIEGGSRPVRLAEGQALSMIFAKTVFMMMSQGKGDAEFERAGWMIRLCRERLNKLTEVAKLLQDQRLEMLQAADSLDGLVASAEYDDETLRLFSNRARELRSLIDALPNGEIEGHGEHSEAS